MKITKLATIVVNMPMIIEGAVVPKQGGLAAGDHPGLGIDPDPAVIEQLRVG